MSEQYVYLDTDHAPAAPHYFADYEGLIQFMLADRRRQSDRHQIILIRYDGCNWISTAKHSEFYTAGRWFDSHILDPDTSLASQMWLQAYQYYGIDQLDKLLDARRLAAEYEDDPGDPIAEDSLAKVHAIDQTIQRIAERLPGRYDRPDIPGALIPAEANFAILEDDHIRFESFDCELLMRLHQDAAEYEHTRAEIRAHWNEIVRQRTLPSDKPTYESGDTWLG